MKNLIYVLPLMALLTSCVSLKSSQSIRSENAPMRSDEEQNKVIQPKFIEHLTLNLQAKTSKYSTNTERIEKRIIETEIKSEIEELSPVQFKYAILMDIPVEEVKQFNNLDLLEEWYGIPYKYGGETKKGIDCSAFVVTYMSVLYGLSLPRTSREQFERSKHITKPYLTEGDLVFFRTRKGRQISHVGIYLKNDKFVHASSSEGVTISSLTDSYWKSRYAGAGRVINHSL
ncbi:MAG TPA: NlpC/P60 family protein [Parasegetibacter sp.]